MLKPNTLIHDRYRIVRLLGQGGFGAVYEALDERLNCRVALKLLVRVSDRISRQFTNEAQLLANLHHPALPRVTDHFADAAGPCLVMDFIPGDDLATLLYDRNAPFPLAQVLRWGDQLLDVLHYLHARQPPIIHRDLKPQNLKLRPDGTLILLDFGLAKGQAGDVQTSSLASSMTAFTRGFAPPEQVEGTGTDARSDLYALGATLYCLLCNTPPPEAQTRLLTVMRGRGDALKPAHTLNPAVPVAVSQVLQQAMALEMEDRPPSAQAMQNLLRAAAGDKRSSAAQAIADHMPRQSSETEIDPPQRGTAPEEYAKLYEQAMAYMTTRQWMEARPYLEVLEREAPGYRDVQTQLVQLRQELALLPDQDTTRRAVGDQQVETRNGRRSPPWLWLAMLGSAAVIAAVGLIVFHETGSTVAGTDPTPATAVAAGETTEAANNRMIVTAAPAIEIVPTQRPTITPTAEPPTATPQPTDLPKPMAVRPASVNASSYAPEGKDACGMRNTYEPNKAVDGAKDTAWRVPGDGRGAWLEFTYTSPIMVTEVGIVAGFDKIDPCDATDRFYQGRIVRKVRLEFDNGQQVEVALEPVRDPQYVTLDNIRTERIRIVVLESDPPPTTNGRDIMALSDVDVLARSLP